MCSTNSLRKSSYQRLQSAAFTSSSDFSGIGGFSLSNIFKSSPRPAKQPGSVSERYYFPSPPKPKPDDTFIPYINERDRMNRLISHSNREPKRARKGAELLSSLTPGKTMEGFTNAYYTPKEKKQHLTCLLSMDPNFFNDSSNDAAAQDSELVQDAEDSLSQRPLSRFKLNIPKGRQICMLKSVSAKRNIKKSKSGHNTPRDDVAFLTIKREEPLHLRTQSNFDYPSVGHYDTKNADVLKPRIKATVISKLQLDRHKAAPQARESVSTPHRETRKLVTDFSKQTGRGNLWVKEEKKEIMKRRDVKTEMDSPVPFANNKSSSSKTKLPMGVVVNTQLPYELKLVKEVTSNVKKLYNISNDKTESNFISSREKKMKRLDQRTIEHAWIQHFS